MKPFKAAVALIKDEPLNVEEKFERLELETNRKLEQFEEAIGVFKDLVVKLYEEKEQLEAENASLRSSISGAATKVKDAVVKPFTQASEEFVELLVEEPQVAVEDKNGLKAELNNMSFNPNSDEMARTIAWMREKFGLSSKVKTESKRAKATKRK